MLLKRSSRRFTNRYTPVTSRREIPKPTLKHEMAERREARRSAEASSRRDGPSRG